MHLAAQLLINRARHGALARGHSADAWRVAGEQPECLDDRGHADAVYIDQIRKAGLYDKI